jgi:hypothetical protein
MVDLKILLIVSILVLVVIKYKKTSRVHDPSRIGFDTVFWGPHVWATFHVCALSFPRDPSSCEKKAMNSLFQSMIHNIPCKTCRDCYTKLIEVVPPGPFIELGRSGAFAYSWLLHNLVSKKTGKPLVAFDDAAAHWLATGAVYGSDAAFVRRAVHQLVQDAQMRGVARLLETHAITGEQFINVCSR